jgi:hypothetical protein
MTSHRLRLQISSPAPPPSSSSSGEQQQRVNSVPKWAPHSVIDRRALTELSAISGQTQTRFTQVQYSTVRYSTRPSHLWRAGFSPVATSAPVSAFSVLRNGTGQRRPIDIDLLTPFSPIHVGVVEAQMGSAAAVPGTCPPGKWLPSKTQSVKREYYYDLAISESRILRLLPLQQACAPLLAVQGY